MENEKKNEEELTFEEIVKNDIQELKNVVESKKEEIEGLIKLNEDLRKRNEDLLKIVRYNGGNEDSPKEKKEEEPKENWNEIPLTDEEILKLI